MWKAWVALSLENGAGNIELGGRGSRAMCRTNLTHYVATFRWSTVPCAMGFPVLDAVSRVATFFTCTRRASVLLVRQYLLIMDGRIDFVYPKLVTRQLFSCSKKQCI